jgi:hypothetical protein
MSAQHSFSAKSVQDLSLRSAFFIVDVGHENFEEIVFERLEDLEAFKDQLLPDLELKECGRTCHLTNAGPLTKIKLLVTHLRPALQELSFPAKLVLHGEGHPKDADNELITAVNLACPIDSVDLPPDMRCRIQYIVFMALHRYHQTTGVVNQPLHEIQFGTMHHFIGGPCKPRKISRCIVPYGVKYTITESLDEALSVAHKIARNASKKCSTGETSVTKVPVLIFWGRMEWYRTELLYEIARGIWGLYVPQGENWWRFSETQNVMAKCKDSMVLARKSSLTLPHIAAVGDRLGV